MIQLGYGVGCCRRTKYICSCSRGYTVRYRYTCQPSVGSSTCLCSQRYICRHRIQAGLELSATRIVILKHWLRISISRLSCHSIYFILVIAELRYFSNHLAQLVKLCFLLRCHRLLQNLLGCFCNSSRIRLDALLRHLTCHLAGYLSNHKLICLLAKIEQKRFLVFSHGNLLLLKHQLLDGEKGICHIGNTEALRSGKVVNTSALLTGLASGHTVIYHTCQERKGHALRMRLVDCIVCIDQQGNKVIHLRAISIVEFFKGLHVFHSRCLRANLFSTVYAAGKYKFQRTAHIVEGCIMPAVCLTGHLWLHTADNVVASGIL